MTAYDVAIIGGGIIGTSAASYLAEAGRSVVLFERAELAAGASGRNSGAIQHPFDRQLAELHWNSLELYQEQTEQDAEFVLPAQPAGLMLVSFDEAVVAATAAAMTLEWPELSPALLPVGAAAAVEPALHPELAACLLATGYPVAPAMATLSFARRAQLAGVDVRTGAVAEPALIGGRVMGVRLTSGETVAADQVLVAAGPWTPSLVPGWSTTRPIRAVWGVVASTSIANAPRHVLEETGIDQPGGPPDRMFSLVTAGGRTSIGSTFLAEEPDASSLAAEVVAHGRMFVPALENAAITSVRACARPVAFDGRPIIGPVPGVEGMFVCAGHGPWGISTGPASARLIADVMLGESDDVGAFSPLRVPQAG